MNKTFFILFTAILTSPLYGSELRPTASQLPDQNIDGDLLSAALIMQNLGESRSEPNQPSRDHICSMCNRSLSSKDHLKRHIEAVHEKKRPVRCTVTGCKSSFYDNSGRDRHMRRIHDAKISFECNYCDEKFNKKPDLDAHMHTNHEKPHRCEYCDKSFARKQGLTRHVRTHTGEKPYQCLKCNKRFTSKTGVEKHLKAIHLKERPYQCSDCSRKFADKSSVTMHRKAVHLKKKPLKCSECGRKFARRGDLNRHMRSVHSDARPFA